MKKKVGIKFLISLNLEIYQFLYGIYFFVINENFECIQPNLIKFFVKIIRKDLELFYDYIFILKMFQNFGLMELNLNDLL